jgi:hypothetical protein
VTRGLRRPAESGPWPGILSCALALVGAAILLVSSSLSLQGSYGEADGEQSVGFNATFATDLGPATTVGTPACLVAGLVLGLLAATRSERWRLLGWTGVALNAVSLVLFAALLVADLAQRGG